MLIYADRAGLWCRPPLSEKDIGPHLGGWALYPHIHISTSMATAVDIPCWASIPRICEAGYENEVITRQTMSARAPATNNFIWLSLLVGN